MKYVAVAAFTAWFAGAAAFAEDESRPVQPLQPVQQEETKPEEKKSEEESPRASHRKRSRKSPGFRFGIDDEGFRRIQEAIEGEIDRMKKRLLEDGPLGERLRGFLGEHNPIDDPEGLIEDLTRQIEEMLGGEFGLDFGRGGRGGPGGEAQRRFFGETRVYKFENGKWTSEVHRFGDQEGEEEGDTTTVVEPGEILGLRVAAVDEPLRAQLDLPRSTGLLVEEVVPGSRADRAGFRAWDVIVEVGGKTQTIYTERGVETGRIGGTTVKVSDVLDDLIREDETIVTVIRRGQRTDLVVPGIEKK